MMTDCTTRRVEYPTIILNRVFPTPEHYGAWLDALTYTPPEQASSRAVAHHLAVHVSLHPAGGLVTLRQAQDWISFSAARLQHTIRHIEDHTLCKTST
jgi:hypothetical protein